MTGLVNLWWLWMSVMIVSGLYTLHRWLTKDLRRESPGFFPLPNMFVPSFRLWPLAIGALAVLSGLMLLVCALWAALT